MKRTLLEIESLTDFDAHIATARDLAGWLVQSIDLTGRDAVLRNVDPAGALFLGCALADATHLQLVRRGARVFPALDDVPVNPYRARLYAADELYDSPAYAESLDARVYAWVRSRGQLADLPSTLAMALHDHAITDALDEVRLDPTRVIGVMGGHKLGRDEPAYEAAVRLGAALTADGAVVLTGGGPGAMEAANLGSHFAERPDEIAAARALLATAPSFRPSIEAWVATARAVRERWAVEEVISVGIPTWHYGHEPPNLFATHIAKYFQNALREDTLLQRCRGGIVCLPGAAGTVQEIFQATTANYYATDTPPVPMVLVGRAYWTQTFPAWQLLSALGSGRAMGSAIHLVDAVAEVPAALRRHRS